MRPASEFDANAAVVLTISNMEARWADINSTLDPLLLPFLETATEYMDADKRRPLKQATVEKLQERISDLIGTVTQNDTLDAALKQAVIDVLAQLRIVLSRHLVDVPTGMTRAPRECGGSCRSTPWYAPPMPTRRPYSKLSAKPVSSVAWSVWRTRTRGVLTVIFGVIQTAAAIKLWTPLIVLPPAQPLKLLGPGTVLTST
jgi:hypothetical protein